MLINAPSPQTTKHVPLEVGLTLSSTMMDADCTASRAPSKLVLNDVTAPSQSRLT